MRARRSCLSVPGSSEKMLSKAPGLGADELVIDLEDSVAAAAKDGARELVASAAAGGDWTGRLIAVRVNGLDTPWCYRDVVELIERAPGTIASLVVPKVERPGDVEWVDRLLGMVEGSNAQRPVALQALIETASGLRRVGEIARASGRLETLILGYADLAASLGRPPAHHGEPERWRWPQEALVLAARDAGLQAIDGPHLALRDDAGLRAWSAHVRDLGYDGKWALHPAQVEPLNAAFSPSEEEFARASAVLAALEEAERSQGRGAIMLDGEMVDEASRKLATQVVARGRAAGLGGARAPAEASP